MIISLVRLGKYSLELKLKSHRMERFLLKVLILCRGISKTRKKRKSHLRTAGSILGILDISTTRDSFLLLIAKNIYSKHPQENILLPLILKIYFEKAGLSTSSY